MAVSTTSTTTAEVLPRRLRELIEAYAYAYSPTSGESLSEYIDRAALDVYPASYGSNAERRAFRQGLRGQMRGRGYRA